MIRAGLLILMLASGISAGAGEPRLDPDRERAVRASLTAAANYAADVLLRQDGQSRGDYDITNGRWQTYETVWHTGQVVAGLTGAADVTGDKRFFGRALDGARFITGLRLEEPLALKGMINAVHDADNPRITMTTLTDGAAPVFEIARRTDDAAILGVLTGAGDWMASELWIPERRMFYDVIEADGRVLGRDLPMDPSIDKDDARYGTEGSYYAHLYRATGEKRYLELFLEPCRRMVADQVDGVWPHLRPNDRETGSLHGRFNIWYAEALLEAYGLTGDDAFLDAALATARTYAAFPEPNGAMYYRHRLDGWRSVESPSGSVAAFAGILWLKLSALGYPEFDPLIEASVDFLLANQYPGDHPDLNLAGGYFELWTKNRGGDFHIYHRDIATAFGLRFLSDYLKHHDSRSAEDPE